MECSDYLADEGGEALSERFLEAARLSFEEVARMPKAGALCGFTTPGADRIRRWPVQGFEHWLIFYLPKDSGVEIIHVIHGARDIDELLK